MKLILENFRQYLDADEDTLTGLSFEEINITSDFSFY